MGCDCCWTEMIVLEKGDGDHKAEVRKCNKHDTVLTSCYLCDPTNCTTELCDACHRAITKGFMPVSRIIRSRDGTKRVNLNPLKAVRERCLDCSG